MRAPSLRILLIDDNRHGLVARRAVLEQLGHKVSTASSGQDGIDQFHSQPFDLVVTDYRMPEVSGQQVIRKLRQHSPKIPIILLSGYVEALGITEQSTGADIVLSKGPGEVQALLRAVARLSKRRVSVKPAPKPPATARAQKSTKAARSRAAKAG
jgi:CheY-like chemotaxis protein